MRRTFWGILTILLVGLLSAVKRYGLIRAQRCHPPVTSLGGHCPSLLTFPPASVAVRPRHSAPASVGKTSPKLGK